LRVVNARSSAIPLALLFAALVVYASLYPFDGWQWSRSPLWAFLLAPWPRYWTWFDLLSNLAGYVPLGFLLALGLLRSGAGGWSWPLAVLLAGLLSMGVEVVQHFLPTRVPSNLDLGLNLSGAAIGAGAACQLERWGGLRLWSRFRQDWFVPRAHGSLVLLCLWPFALLYPASVPFGLGQIWERFESLMVQFLAETPFVDWLPSHSETAVPLSPLSQALCVALGLLAPVLMGFADVKPVWRRLVYLAILLLAGFGASGLSSALTYGPEHAWAWIDSPTLVGLGLAFGLGLASLALPPRLCHVGLILALAVSLSLLNQMSGSAYLDQSLAVWEQGRFIRFHGLSQWLGWCWPFAAMVYGVRAVSAQQGGLEPRP
jgi:VanZ family protein